MTDKINSLLGFLNKSGKKKEIKNFKIFNNDRDTPPPFNRQEFP